MHFASPPHCIKRNCFNLVAKQKFFQFASSLRTTGEGMMDVKPELSINLFQSEAVPAMFRSARC